MDLVIAGEPVAKKKGQGGSMIRVSEELGEALRKVCALEHMSAAEFSDAYYLPIVEKRYRELIEAESKRIQGGR